MWPAPNITLLEDTQHQRQDQTKLIWLGNSSKWTRKRSKHRLCKENKRPDQVDLVGKFFKMDQKKEQAQVMQG